MQAVDTLSLQMPDGNLEQLHSSLPGTADIKLLLLGLQYAADGIIALDDSCTVVFYNRQAEALWNLPQEQVIGQSLECLFAEDDSCGNDVSSTLARLDTQRPSVLFRLTPLTCDRPRTLEVRATRVVEDGRGLYLLFARDITQTIKWQLQVERLSLALDHSNNAILLCDRHARINHVNEGFTRMFGYTPEETLRRCPRDLLRGTHTSPETIELLDNHHFAGVAHQADLLAYRKDGSPLWVSVVATPVPDEEAEHGTFVNVLTDITATKTNEVLNNKVLAALLLEKPLSESMAMVCDEIERIAPDLIVSILSVDRENTLRPLPRPTASAALDQLINALVRDNNTGTCSAALARGRPVLAADIESDPLFGAHRTLAAAAGVRACWSHPIKSARGQILGTLAFYYRQPLVPSTWHTQLAQLCLHLCSFAFEREQTKARVHQLAFFDALTGLPNRMMFNARAEQAMATADTRAAPMALLFIDLDRFKRINETQGHAAGDGLLRDLAARVRDGAGKNAVLGRQTADEFLLMLSDCDLDQASRFSERLLAHITAPFVVGHMSVQISASIGVAMYPDDGRDIDTLLQHADLAMHRAKDQGGGRFRFFSNDMNRLAKERVAMESALREALRRNQLQLHYQPQIFSGSHALYGVEALLRWVHPQMGNVSPAQFIPMAEECGLMEDISHWVLQEVCRQQADWRQRDIGIPRVSVNLSASNFESSLLVERLQQLLAQHALPADSLVLELTESVMLSPQKRVLENLDAINAMGIQLSLDDFGTGYSSLSHLHRLPITELKLDKSFVQDLEHCETARTLINSVLRIGENLRKHVVAEGVETFAQQCYLEQQGCEILQGYLCSPPLPTERLEHWLGTYKTGSQL